jgi:hypothetical protein
MKALIATCLLLFHLAKVQGQTQLPIAKAGADMTTTVGTSVQLKAAAIGNKNLSYKWTPATNLNYDNVISPIVTPTINSTITYTLTVTDEQENMATDQVDVTATCAFNIGQSYGGGTIFYVDGTGCHGLIAAPSDLSTGIQWWNGSYVSITTTSTNTGTGHANTLAVIAAQGTGTYAASIVNGVTINGYNDWFLPSRDELVLISVLSSSLKSAMGISTTSWYWSSSSDISANPITQSQYTWAVFVNDSNHTNSWLRNTSYRVRPVRVF